MAILIGTGTPTGDFTFTTQSLNFGEKLQSMFDFVYNQVVIDPVLITAGTITSDFYQQIRLWNATSEPQNLQSIVKVGTSGIDFDGFQSGIIQPGEILYYDLTILPDGPDEINAQLIYDFSDDFYNTTVRITGNRVASFNYDINWSNGVQEFYRHFTDVVTSYNGKEQRANISEQPRYSVEYFYTFTDEERIEAETFIYNNGAKEVLIPMWHQKSVITQPVGAGDNVIVVDLQDSSLQVGSDCVVSDGFNHQFLKVQTILNNTVTLNGSISFDIKEKGSVAPSYYCKLNQNVAFDYENKNLSQLLLRFDIADSDFLMITNDFDNLEEYKGLKVLARKPTRDITFTKTFERTFEDVDFGYGRRERFEKNQKASVNLTYNFSLFGKKEIAETKAFFNNMKGRYNEFLVETGSNDMILSQNIPTGTDTIIIKSNNQTSFANDSSKQYLRIETVKGNVYIRDILSYTDLGDGETNVVLNDTINESLDISQVASIQYLANARFNNDEMQINNITDDYAEISIDIKILRSL